MELAKLNPAELNKPGQSELDSPLWRDAFHRTQVTPLVLLAIYERLPEFGEDHGGQRFAVMFVRAEANCLYETLYGRLFPDNPPFGILLQAHGGGGANPMLCQFSTPYRPMRLRKYQYGNPRFLLAERDEDKEIWQGYTRVQCPPETGGMHDNERSLFEYIGNDLP